jgi:selenocysteine-specific elongation factor
MLAGVGGVDACLFVVAATEGWKPQSEEHLRILELLGIRHGIVALTKVDLVDDEWRELAAMEVADHVAGTFLDGATVVPVAAPAGRGLDELRAALDGLVRATPAAEDRGRPRLWVDRAFAARGAGTVVTGTLTGGGLAVGDQLVLGPAATPVRVRALQSLGEAIDAIGPGHRVAANLVGVEHTAVERGDALVQPDRWRPSTQVDASLSVLASLVHPVTRRGAYVAHVGSGEHPVRVRVLGTGAIRPGTAGLVRLHLSLPLPLLPGDRYVLRESGRQETVGGGEVLDVAPVLPASKARPDRRVDRVIAERGWIRADELEVLTGERREPQLGPWVAAPGAVDALVAALDARVAAAGPLGLDVAGLDERERDALALVPGVGVSAGRARPVTAPDPFAGHPVLQALSDGGLAPELPDGVDRAELRELVRRGLVLERDGIHFVPATVDGAARLVARLLSESPGGITVSTFREAAGITRRHALPLLAELDARGMTRRRGDVRIAGPRLPAPASRPPREGTSSPPPPSR